MERPRSYRFIQRLTLITGLLIFLTATSFANNEEDERNGHIKGKIVTTDGKNAADIAVVLTETKQTSISDADGAFSFRNIPPGDYHLTVTMPGYNTVIQTVTVESSKTTTVTLQLYVSRKELQEVVVIGNHNRLVKSSSDYVSKMPLKNLENPQVYTTITKDLMMEQQVFSVDDAIKNAPGLTKMWEPTGRSGDGGSYYNSRGFIVQSLLRNGVAGTVSSSIDAANLERIEVIKGPSATLFGNVLTSYGGLINRVTKAPYDRFGGEISYATGSYSFNRLSADINTPLDPEKDVLLRVNTAYNYERSFQDKGWSKNFVLAPSLSYRVNDKLSFRFDAEFFTGQKTGLRVFFFPFGITTDALGATRADQLKIDYKRAYASDDLYQTGRSTNFFGQMNYKLSDQWTSQTNVTITSSYSDGPSPYFYLLPKNENDPGSQYISRNDQFTDDSRDDVVEIQQNFIGDFQIGSLRNRFVGGLDFFHHNSDQFFSGNTYDTIRATGDIPTYRDFNRTNMDQLYQTKGTSFVFPSIFVANSYSAYVSDVLNITDNLELLAALRLDYFDNKGNVDPAKDTITDPYTQLALSPKLGIVYQPVKDKVAIFANYQNGFTNKTGRDFVNKKALKPEQANQIEGGVKLSIFEGRLNATFSYYEIKVKNVVRPAPNPNFSIQDGTQSSKGFEAEVIANPFHGMNVVAGFSYNDSKYEKIEDKGLEGRRPNIAGSPVSANLWLSYRFPEGKLKGLGLGFGGNYASDNKVLNSASQGVFILPAYTILNGSVFYDNSKFRVAAKLDNLTNQKYWIGYTTVNPQKLRSFTGSIAFKF